MRATLQRHAIGLALVLPFLLLSTQDAEGQRRGKKAKEEAKVTAEITAEFTLTIGVREQIREYTWPIRSLSWTRSLPGFGRGWRRGSPSLQASPRR